MYSTFTYDYITITDMFTIDKDAGETFEFYISHLRNPISQSPIPFEVLTFESVSELTPDGQSIFGGEIDRGNTFLEAEESIGIDENVCSVTADDSTVQEFSVFYVAFKVPIPVEEGCIVIIQLPEDFSLSAGDLARVEGWGIFGFKRDLNVGIDEQDRTIKIVDQCQKYSPADVKTQVRFSMI